MIIRVLRYNLFFNYGYRTNTSQYVIAIMLYRYLHLIYKRHTSLDWTYFLAESYFPVDFKRNLRQIEPLGGSQDRNLLNQSPLETVGNSKCFVYFARRIFHYELKAS